MIRQRFIFLLSLQVIILSACYYDNQAEIHPNSNCDVTNSTYSAKVSPILRNNCLTCHSGSQPSGGIALDNYQGVQTVAASGRLMGSLKSASGYKPMPPQGKLSDCDLNTIQAWIDAGRLNN